MIDYYIRSIEKMDVVWVSILYWILRYAGCLIWCDRIYKQASCWTIDWFRLAVAGESAGLSSPKEKEATRIAVSMTIA